MRTTRSRTFDKNGKFDTGKFVSAGWGTRAAFGGCIVLMWMAVCSVGVFWDAEVCLGMHGNVFGWVDWCVCVGGCACIQVDWCG